MHITNIGYSILKRCGIYNSYPSFRTIIIVINYFRQNINFILDFKRHTRGCHCFSVNTCLRSFRDLRERRYRDLRCQGSVKRIASDVLKRLYQEYLVEKLKSCCRSMAMVFVREFRERKKKNDIKERLQNWSWFRCRLILDKRITVIWLWWFLPKFIILSIWLILTWHNVYDKWYILYMLTYMIYSGCELSSNNLIYKVIIYIIVPLDKGVYTNN